MKLVRFILIPAVLFLLAGTAGAGWVQQQSGTTVSLSRVFFIDPQTGWAAGDSGFLLRTTDSGTNWERNVVDTVMHSCRVLWFQDGNHGWAGGSGWTYEGMLFGTTDGGGHWQLQKRDSGISYQDVKFVTPLKGWLVGAMLNSGGGGIGFLFLTTDGGQTWSLRDSSSRCIYWRISFPDTLFGLLAAGNPGMGSPGYESWGFLKRTTDGGATWQKLNEGLTMFDDIRFADLNFAWCSTYFDAMNNTGWGVEKTTDRGGSWTGIFGRSTVYYDYGSLAVVDSQKGWILHYDTLFGTYDGGQTWNPQVPPGIKWDICFVDSLNGWIVGNQGLILHTTDGGSGVWEEPVPSRLPPYASRVTVFPNPFTSFATVPGHFSERFTLYDISGRRVGTYRGDRIGEGLPAGVYFLRAEKGDRKPLRVVKVR